MSPTPAAGLPGRKLVLQLIRIIRFATVLYVAGISIATIIVSGCIGHVGGIIASVYLIPASFVLVALEFGCLNSRVSALRHEMQPARIIAIQFLGAMIAGVGWPELVLFILGCVAFGLGLGLMNLVGIYYLCWGGQAQEEGSDAWSQDSEKSPRGVFLTSGEEDALLLHMGPGGGEGRVTSRDTGSSEGSGPEVLSVD